MSPGRGMCRLLPLRHLEQSLRHREHGDPELGAAEGDQGDPLRGSRSFDRSGRQPGARGSGLQSIATPVAWSLIGEASGQSHRSGMGCALHHDVCFGALVLCIQRILPAGGGVRRIRAFCIGNRQGKEERTIRDRGVGRPWALPSRPVSTRTDIGNRRRTVSPASRAVASLHKPQGVGRGVDDRSVHAQFRVPAPAGNAEREREGGSLRARLTLTSIVSLKGYSVLHVRAPPAPARLPGAETLQGP